MLRTNKEWLFIMPILYVMAAHGLFPFLLDPNREEEIFPLFTWALYAKSQPQVTYYTIKLTLEQNGVATCEIQNCDIVPPSLLTKTLFSNLQKVGRDLEHKGLKKNELLNFEKLLTSILPRDFTYTIIKKNIQIKEYHKINPLFIEKIIYEKQ